MLQTVLISGIGKHEMVRQSGIAVARIQHLLVGGDKSWEAWTTRCLPRVKKFYAEVLKWEKRYFTLHRDKSTALSQGFDGENGGQVISPKCSFGASCLKSQFSPEIKLQSDLDGSCPPASQLCGVDDMNKYIDIVYDKKQLLVKHMRKFFLYSLGPVHSDAAGIKWLKINQWKGGMYERNTEAYGTVLTAGPGDGKLADTEITKAISMNADWGANYYKVTSSQASENLYIKTLFSYVYDDSKPRFGFPADPALLMHTLTWTGHILKWTYQTVATAMPTQQTHWHNLWNKEMFESWGFRKQDQSCNRWFMGHDGDECYKWDHSGNTNKRCFSGGLSCKDGAWTDHAPLKNIQMYLRIIY
eukprot:Skav233198  [mRNA]  locus=scaffold24:408862:413162:- [translate_table: standard]